MYEMFRKAGFSLLAIVTLILLLASSAMARDRNRSDRGDIVGMDVRARGGGTVGTVEDVVRAPGGRGWDVIIDLHDGGEVTVPRSRLTVGQNHVMFHGSRDDLNDTRRGYYRDRYRDRDYDRDRYRERDDYRDRNERGFGDIIDQFLN